MNEKIYYPLVSAENLIKYDLPVPVSPNNVNETLNKIQIEAI